ncbi:MAG: beta-propeller domain-containing protein [Actinomycetota bacterium]
MRHPLIARYASLVLAGALVTTSCSTVLGDEETGAGARLDGDVVELSADEIILTAGLQTVADCSALLERIKEEAVERVGPYGFGPGVIEPEIMIRGLDGDDMAIDEMMEEEAVAADAAAPTTTTGAAAQSAARDGGDAFSDDAAESTTNGVSGTNNQELGVDEADLVKTDGERLVIASDNTLRVIDTTGDVPRLVKTIELPDEVWGGQMFLSGDRVLLMSSGWTDRPFLRSSIPTDWYPGSNLGRLLEIDLESGEVVRTLEFEGAYLSARDVDGSIRIVLTASADRFAWVYPSNEGAEESAEKANRALIEESTIEQWLPTFRLTERGETVSEGPLVDCDRVHLPTEFAGFGSMVMLTVDLENGMDLTDTISVFTDAQTMYASTDRVAIATPRWPTYNDDELIEVGEFKTAIHTFDITDPARAAYVASGLVDGTLLNQYSLSEYDGRLRVATTAGSPWSPESSESFVSVLEEQGNVLKVVGQVGGLGRGEDIFSVRFMGPTAYVVTFRQIDPLYTVDLSDPERPEVLGELKIPGFSDYLHPVGEDHLLGVGQDGDDDGRLEGAVVSLFDVSDLTNPRRTAMLPLGPSTDQGFVSDSYSPVGGDAKAFTYWNDVAIVPVSWWAYNEDVGSESNGSAAVLVAVDPDGDLTEIGRVGHPQVRQCEGGFPVDKIEPLELDGTTTAPLESDDAEADFARPAEEQPATTIPGDAIEDWCWTWSPEINRSIVIGDDLYTLSAAGVKVNRFDGLAEVTWIPFEGR